MAVARTYNVLTTGGQTALAVTSATVVSLTVPAQAVKAKIYVKLAQLNWFSDARTPTTTATGNGEYAYVNDQIYLDDRGEMVNFRCIAATATNCALDVTYFS